MLIKITRNSAMPVPITLDQTTLSKLDNLFVIRRGISNLLNSRELQIQLLDTYGSNGKLYILIPEVTYDTHYSIVINSDIDLRTPIRSEAVPNMKTCLIYQRKDSKQNE